MLNTVTLILDFTFLFYLLQYIFQAFGSPTIIAHVGDKPVMLFGSDRFPILAQVLGIPQPLYNTIVGVQTNFCVCYPIHDITRDNV